MYANIVGGVPITVASDDNNYNVFTDSNNNYLVNPFSTKVVERIWGVPATYSLTQWRSTSNFDANSVGSFYNWTFPTDDSFLVTNPSANPTTLNYTNTADLNNNAVLTVTLPAFSSRILIRTSPLSNLQNSMINEITVYPNPSSTGKFFITIPRMTDDYMQLAIYTLDGKLIFEDKHHLLTNDITIKQKGIYVLKTVENDKMYTNKIIVN